MCGSQHGGMFEISNSIQVGWRISYLTVSSQSARSSIQTVYTLLCVTLAQLCSPSPSCSYKMLGGAWNLAKQKFHQMLKLKGRLVMALRLTMYSEVRTQLHQQEHIRILIFMHSCNQAGNSLYSHTYLLNLIIYSILQFIPPFHSVILAKNLDAGPEERFTQMKKYEYKHLKQESSVVKSTRFCVLLIMMPSFSFLYVS